MEHQITSSTADDSEIPTEFVQTPTPSLAMFDVNKFLKKTFSEFDLGRNGDDRETASGEQQERFQSGPLKNDVSPSVSKEQVPRQDRKSHQRRAGSVPATTSSRIMVEKREPAERMEKMDDSNIDGQLKQRNGDRPASNRRGRLRDRDERHQRIYCCAYCGQEVVARSSNNATHHLYCAACTSFFIRHSPSELQRRIAYDEMTQPSGALLRPPAPPIVSDVGTSSGVVDNKETAPLLSGTNLNKVSLVSNDDEENENGESLLKENGQQSRREEETEDVSRQRYARNDRRQGRGHVRLEKARQAPVLPYRQHQHHIRPGRVQLRDDSSTKANLFGETAPVVVWSKEIHGNNGGGSRRSSCTSASSLNRPTCRICHLYGEPGDTLVSPCRCAGTMQYVHTSCLVHWLEISTKKVLPSPQCELCGYHYRTHHCYRFRRMHAPSCNNRDRVLHVVFVIMILVMIGCSALSAVYLRQDKGYKRAALNSDDIIVIASALLFFCAFFVAVFTQYRAETSVCRLCLRAWLINRHWRVKDYDRNLDYERHSKIGHSVIMEQI